MCWKKVSTSDDIPSLSPWQLFYMCQRFLHNCGTVVTKWWCHDNTSNHCHSQAAQPIDITWQVNSMGGAEDGSEPSHAASHKISQSSLKSLVLLSVTDQAQNEALLQRDKRTNRALFGLVSGWVGEMNADGAAVAGMACWWWCQALHIQRTALAQRWQPVSQWNVD